MSFQAVVINVMIASPSDVPTERQNIRNIIHSWNAIHAQDRKVVLLPLGWETHGSPMMGDRPQAIINRQVLDHCDLLVAVFWTRLGSPSGQAPSGTVEEITKHLSAGKPAMIYFSDMPVPDRFDEVQYRALREFRKDCLQRGLVETYTSIEEFRDKCTRQLTQTILRYFKALPPLSETEIREIAQQPQTPELSDEARDLLLETAQDPNGQATCIPMMGGTMVRANERQFVQMGVPRSEAKWKAAIDELVTLGLFEPMGSKGEFFAITHAGYETADRLRQQTA